MRLVSMPAALLIVLLASVFAAVPCRGEGGAISGYSDPAAFREQVRSIAQAEHAAASSLGRTPGGRPVLLLTISAGEPGDRPALLVLGSVHGPHLLGSELAVRLARRLSSGEDEAAAELRERFTFYIIPRPNPDASAAFFTRPHFERTVNARPRDEDRDGRTDEDGPDDLNGDGLITAMRIEDPRGTWIEHPGEPRVMVEADRSEGERGQYRLIGREGVDNDGDERFNEDGPGGVNFNRNFTFDYPYFEAGAGPHQVSEPGTRGVADFAFAHPNIAAVLSFGPNDNLMHPWESEASGRQGRIKTQLLRGDAAHLGAVAAAYRDINGGEDAPPSPAIGGSLGRWAYFHFGRWSLVARGWWPGAFEAEAETDKEAAGGPEDDSGSAEVSEDSPEPPDEKKDEAEDPRRRERVELLRWFDRAGIDAFVEWTEVDHPRFPERAVEVGGIKPFHMLNPPADRIDKLAEAHYRFLRELMDRMPEVKVERVEAEPLGGGVVRLTATVVNNGYLPTMAKMGEISEAPHPLMLSLGVPEGTRYLRGSPRTRLDPLPGGGGHAEHTWLIRTDADVVTVRVSSPSVGSDRKKVDLP